jgi:hypothetical protein
MRTLTFEKSSAEITLQDLEQTVRLEMASGGLPKNRPAEHFTLIGSVYNNLSRGLVGTNATIVADPIHINEKYAKRIMWQGEKDSCPIDKYLVERVVTRFNVKRPGNNIVDQSVAISYTELGIQIALGTNVRICSNMNIFGNNIVSTYGGNKVPFDKMVEVVKYWMHNLNGFHAADVDIINKLSAVKMDRKIADELIGMLIRKAVLSNHGQKQVNAPMNVSQVCRMIEQGTEVLTKEDFSNFTAWDFTNICTEHIKPKNADMATLLNTTQSINNFVCEAFDIRYQTDVAPMAEMVLS